MDDIILKFNHDINDAKLSVKENDLNSDQHIINESFSLLADTYNSDFPLSHDTYNGIFVASNGIIYYVLSSVDLDEGGQMYSFNPESFEIKLCGDLTEVCGEKGRKTIPQGKSHVNFIEVGDKLFFGTHIGYYNIVKGMDKMGTPPEGYSAYPGGHLLSFDLKSGKFENLAIAPHNEGILSMNMDTQRGDIYGITWPSGYFFRFNIYKKKMHSLGPVSGQGENGSGIEYRTLCRSIAINPDNGFVYYTTSDGAIFCCKPDQDVAEPLHDDDLKKDYFGQYDPTSPGHMGYNWRQVFWHPEKKLFYGVHGNSGYLFTFDPINNQVKMLNRLTSLPSQRSGMFDQFSYGYLGFALGHDKKTIYYLTGAPLFIDGRRVVGKLKTAKGEAKGLEYLHLITYDISSSQYLDHGPIFFKNGQYPLYVNSIAIGLNGMIYFLGRITENGIARTDLISIPDPIKERKPFST